MSASPAVALSGASGEISIWWAHHSHRYLLAAMGGGAFASGVALALWAPAHLVVPPAGVLLILGALTLSLSLVTTALRVRLESEWARTAAGPSAPVPAAATASHCAECAAPPEAHHAAHALLRQIEVWNHLRRRASSATFASTTGATPSDFMWSSWVPAVHTLPVALVGPVPETAYVPPRPGEPERFPEMGVPGEPPVIPLDAPMLPDRIPPPREGIEPKVPVIPPVSRADADVAAFRPELIPSRPAPPATGDWTTRSGAYPPGSFETPTGPAAPGPEGAVGPELPGDLDWVQWEALTPLPPHLRPTPVPFRSRGSRALRAPAVPDGTSRCATCASEIEVVEAWRRCPDCARPICPECIVTALVEQDRGWCEGCANARVRMELPAAS